MRGCLRLGKTPSPRIRSENGRNRSTFGADLFQIRFYRSFIPEKKPEVSVDAYLQMANDVLTFIKFDTSSWRARFEVELLIYDAKGELADRGDQRGEPQAALCAEPLDHPPRA